MRIQKVNLNELPSTATPLDAESNWSYGKGGDGLWFISYTDDKCLKQQQFIFPEIVSKLMDAVEERALERGECTVKRRMKLFIEYMIEGSKDDS